MYSWRQREDTRVFDEPFYGIYLRRFDPGHPGRHKIIESMPLDYNRTVEQLGSMVGPPLRYIKNICHHLDALNESVLDLFTNVLLIRHPAKVLASLTAKLGPEFDFEITGLAQQQKILDHELATGRSPIVLDSASLLADPERTLTGLCRLLEVEFDGAMLSWPAGPKPEDGLWAEYWYAGAHSSTEFVPEREAEPVDEDEHPLLERCLGIYQRIAAHAFDRG